MKFTIVLATLLAVAAASSFPHFGFPEEDIFGGRVINGKPAAVGEAPYIISMRNSPTGSHFCGGSIIDDDWVLTAAHCVLGDDIYCTAGLHDRNVEDGQTIRVAHAIKHRSYGGGVGPYDIALLKLEKSFEFNDRVQKVSLPHDSTPQSGEGTLYGWGRDNSGGLPYILQTVTTDILPFSDCKPQLPFGSPIHNSNICSGSRNAGISACNGDSGGPLVQKSGEETILSGIVSWGYIPCGQANYPSVYTHAGAYLDWVKANKALYN